MSSTLGASLLRTVLSDGTLKILGSGLDKGPIIVFYIDSQLPFIYFLHNARNSFKFYHFFSIFRSSYSDKIKNG